VSLPCVIFLFVRLSFVLLNGTAYVDLCKIKYV